MKSLRLRNIFLAASLGALVACGGGAASSGMQSSSAGTGAALVTLTDAPGDFASYIVNVVSIKLTRADGTVVETLPLTTQVNFAQLVNLSEVISAAQVPAGNYVSASLTLDYAGATIAIDNGGGSVTVPAANILNGATNAPLTSPNNLITLSLKLPSDRPMVVNKGVVANLALDFNLAASNTVAPTAITSTTPASSVTVTVNPVLSASIVPDATKSIRLRGPLVSVSNTSTDTSYTIHVRPFYDHDGDHGDLVVSTTATTTFSINGVSSTGTAGLTALAALPAGALTAALGSFDTTTKTFTAASVLAGSSIPGAGLDSVEGTVIARSGNVLTVSNGLIARHDMGGVEFGHQTIVTVAAATPVAKDTVPGSFAIADISVGQHAQLFGTLGTDSSGNRTLDASAGSVRLQPTSVWGLYGSSTAGVVTMNLQSIDGRQASVFNFAGTGTAAAQDAVAASYTVGVSGGLSAGSATAGTPIRFLGYVNPFGAAPPDFTAQTLVSYAATAARLGVEWKSPGVTAPFVAPLSATNVVINQATLQSAAEHVALVGPQHLDLSTVAAGLKLIPNASATSALYVIAHRASHKAETYSTFADEVAALNTALNGTTTLLELAADGPYDAATGTLSVNHVVFVLND